MGRIAMMSMAVVGLLAASGCNDPNTTSYDPVGVAADRAELVLTDVPLDQIASCVEATKAEAYLGDAVAQKRWTQAGQSDAALTHLCTEIGRNDPQELADMQQDWIAEQAVLYANSPQPTP